MPRAYKGRDRKAISATELETAMQCSHRSYLEHEQGLRRQTLPLARGTAVHHAASADAWAKIRHANALEERDVVDLAVDKFDREVSGNVYYYPKEVTKGKRWAVDHERDRTAGLASLYAKLVSPRLDPDIAEERLFIAIPDGPFDLTGQVDQARRPAVGVIINDKLVPIEAFDKPPRAGIAQIPGTGKIWDFKTRARARGADKAAQSIQLTMYAALYRAMCGMFPGAIELVDLVRSPRNTRVVTSRTSRDVESMKALVARVNAYSAMLGAGVTLPAPVAAWWCGPNACPFWNECPFVDSARRSAAERTEEEL